jgi:hypothetical protein
MSGAADHDRVRAKPFLIEQEGQAGYRLFVRNTRYNSQNYPIVTAEKVDEIFPSASAARTYAKAHFGAIAGQFVLK